MTTTTIANTIAAIVREEGEYYGCAHTHTRFANPDVLASREEAEAEAARMRLWLEGLESRINAGEADRYDVSDAEDIRHDLLLLWAEGLID